jgi:hypothetical protein
VLTRCREVLGACTDSGAASQGGRLIEQGSTLWESTCTPEESYKEEHRVCACVCAGGSQAVQCGAFP